MKNLLPFLLMIAFFYGCDDDLVLGDPQIPDDNNPSQFDSLDFGIKTLHSLAADGALQKENLIISPLSLQAALFMALNGAEGNTESEMADVLSLGRTTPNGHNQEYKNLINTLLKDLDSSDLGVNNSVFYDDGKININNDFRSDLASFYDAEFINQDFDNEATVDIINDWAKEKTEGRIDKILESIDPAEAMFLINALYFKGDWQKGFDPGQTFAGDFRTAEGEVVRLDMMRSDDFRLYVSTNQYEAVDLPLSDSLYSMTFVMPSQSVLPFQFIGDFNTEEFNNFYSDLTNALVSEQRIYLTLPKFELGSNLKMKETLKKMGMKDAFDMAKADFRDFGTAPGNIYLSRVLHDTYLKIDEKGVEGAAVTTVGVGVTSVPPTVNFDRPFLFFLRHIETNTLIFTGYINDPRG